MSQLNDAFGLPVTGATPQVVKALDTFGQEWISYGPDLAVLFPAAAAEPGCALATAYAALQLVPEGDANGRVSTAIQYAVRTADSREIDGPRALPLAVLDVRPC